MANALEQDAAREPLNLTEFQALVLSLPREVSLFLGGGKGGGKTFALGLLIADWVNTYGRDARALVLRMSFPAMRDLELSLLDLFTRLYGAGGFKYSGSEHWFAFGNGAICELGYLADHGDLRRYAGRGRSLLVVDEVGQYADPSLIEILATNMRAPSGVPTRLCLAGNPGDVGQAWLAQRYVYPAPPWTEFLVGDPGQQRRWVSCPSTYRDNPHLDQQEYEATLGGLRRVDPELARALMDGDWGAKRGAFFGSVLSDERTALDPAVWTPEAVKRMETYYNGSYLSPLSNVFICHDWGVSAPSVSYAMFEAQDSFVGPDGRPYAKGSYFALDELATADEENPTRGLGLTVPDVAAGIKKMALRWGHREHYDSVSREILYRVELPGGSFQYTPQPAGTKPVPGIADDAIFAASGTSAGSVADEFKRCGIEFRRAEKGSRTGGWERMRRLLADAGKPDQPGLYISRACRYFWQTAPFIPRDVHNPDDVDAKSRTDHAIDSLRYGVGKTGIGYRGRGGSNYLR